MSHSVFGNRLNQNMHSEQMISGCNQPGKWHWLEVKTGPPAWNHYPVLCASTLPPQESEYQSAVNRLLLLLVFHKFFYVQDTDS